MKAPFEAGVAHARTHFAVTTQAGVTYHIPFSTLEFVALNREATLLTVRTHSLLVTIHGADLGDVARWIADHHLISGVTGNTGVPKVPSASEIFVEQLVAP